MEKIKLAMFRNNKSIFEHGLLRLSVRHFTAGLLRYYKLINAATMDSAHLHNRSAFFLEEISHSTTFSYHICWVRVGFLVVLTITLYYPQL